VTRLSQRYDDFLDVDGISDTVYIGNGEASHDVSLRGKDRETDVDYALNFMTWEACVSANPNLSEMSFEIGVG
jgi:hypothetical protein